MFANQIVKDDPLYPRERAAKPSKQQAPAPVATAVAKPDTKGKNAAPTQGATPAKSAGKKGKKR